MRVKIESPQNIIDSLLLPYMSMIIMYPSLSQRGDILSERRGDIFSERERENMSSVIILLDLG